MSLGSDIAIVASEPSCRIFWIHLPLRNLNQLTLQPEPPTQACKPRTPKLSSYPKIRSRTPDPKFSLDLEALAVCLRPLFVPWPFSSIIYGILTDLHYTGLIQTRINAKLNESGLDLTCYPMNANPLIVELNIELSNKLNSKYIRNNTKLTPAIMPLH